MLPQTGVILIKQQFHSDCVVQQYDRTSKTTQKLRLAERLHLLIGETPSVSHSYDSSRISSMLSKLRNGCHLRHGGTGG